MRKNVLLYVIAFCSMLMLQAQKENDSWYFGSMSGTTFNTGIPVSDGSGKMIASAGSASISDKSTGSILMYTNGSRVFSKAHVTMQNGTLIGGDSTAQQNSIIVPDPADVNKYYIFCVAPDTNNPVIANKGLYYATVDMTQNSGNGAVVLKKQFLMGPTPGKITAIQHCNGKDFWVVAIKYGTDTMYSFPVTSSGIGTPVKSNLGRVYRIAPTYNYGVSHKVDGQIKASPNGKRVAFTSTVYGSSQFIKDKFVQMYDFCPATGVLSNPIIDQFSGFAPGYWYDRLNGVSFSSNSDVLYVASRAYWVTPNGHDTVCVWQYNMNAGSSAAIISSKTAVGKIKGNPYYDFDDLQLASNGKIYANQAVNKFDVINNPNTLGTGCSYQKDVFTHFYEPLFYCCPYTYSLPNMIDGLSYPSTFAVNLGNDTSICSGASVTLSAGNSGATYFWSTGATSQTITVSGSGKYYVSLSNGSCCTVSDTINVTINNPIVNLGGDTTVCTAPLMLNAANAGSLYIWSNGDTTQTSSISTGGEYWVLVNTNGCTATDTIEVTIDAVIPSQKIPNVFTPNDDGKNDVFDLSALNVSEMKLQVYDRWGKLAFETTDPTKKWDGKHNNGNPAIEGTYFWISTFKSTCTGNDAVTEKGTVVLLR